MITIVDAETYVESVTPSGKYDWEEEGSNEGFAAWIFYELGKLPEDDESEAAISKYLNHARWCDVCSQEICAPGYVQNNTEGDFCGDRCLDIRRARKSATITAKQKN